MTQSGYPARFERTLVTRDGATLLIRPVREADRQALEALYAGLSFESAYLRFHGVPPREGPPLERFLLVDYRDAWTLVGESGDRLIGTASFFRDPEHSDRAEVAFTVADDWQGRGVGTLLLEQLAHAAIDLGIDHFDAWTRTDNWKMLAVFREVGFPVRSSFEAGVFNVSVDLLSTEGFLERHALRAAHAAHESVRPFFEPRGVAVIGASRDRTKIGGQILANLREAGFTGPLYPINPSAAEIDGLATFKAIGDVPGPVDLAVIVTPAPSVEQVVDGCLAAGARALVIITAGFAETGDAGRRAQAAIVERVRRAGARLIGPNCMGVLNTHPAVRLNATFAPDYPPAGRIGMSTQSGAIGLAVLDAASRLDFGVSSFVSVGNKADVSGNDVIQYWAEDANTDVIVLYLESFGNPRRFAEIARRTSLVKPIVAVKAGRSQAGVRAAQSHTGALAADDAVVDALFKQCGVIRARTLEELFDVARALGRMPLPAGPRVAILTNAGGLGILAADACEASGLTAPTLTADTIAGLRAFLPAAAGLANPVDMIASASPQDYRRAIQLVLADPSVDSLLALYVPPAVSAPDAVAVAIADAVRDARSAKPVLVSFVAVDPAPAALAGIPVYPFPERAALALSRMVSYGQWRRSARPPVRTTPPVALRALRRRLQDIVAAGREWLSFAEVDDVLHTIGATTVRSAGTSTDEEAVRAASGIGFPVAIKAVGPLLLHKTEVGGVRLGLETETDVREACLDMQSRLGDRLTGFLVQQMAPDGPEFLVGCVTDPQFGPVVACGAGGVMAELLRDVVFRLPPLTEDDAAAMLDQVRGVRLLRGFRGEPRRDERALARIVAACAALADHCPEIVELDFNPVRVGEHGAFVLDARVRVGALDTSSRAGRVDY